MKEVSPSAGQYSNDPLLRLSKEVTKLRDSKPCQGTSFDQSEFTKSEREFNSLNQRFQKLVSETMSSRDYLVVWHILLDIGRALKSYHFVEGEYYLIEKLCLLAKDDNDHKRLKQIQRVLCEISAGLSAVSEQQRKSEADQRFRSPEAAEAKYWVWFFSLYYITKKFPLINVFKRVFVWSGLAVLFAASPQISAFLVALVLSGLLPDSKFGYILRSTAIDLIYWGIGLVYTIRTFFFYYGKAESFSWQKIKEAIAPRSINWSKFWRGFLYTIAPMMVGGIRYFMLIPITVVWYQWLIAACFTACYLFVQTLTEEVQFRRPACEKGNNNAATLWGIVLSSMLFGLVHWKNPEFLVIDTVLGKLAFLSGYVIDGLLWSLAAYFSGGVEMTWGMHFANNLFLAVLVGYAPSPLVSMPLITIFRGKGSGYAKFYSSIQTFGAVMAVWSQRFLYEIKTWVNIYICETLFRPKYFVPPVNSYHESASASSMAGEDLPKAQTEDPENSKASKSPSYQSGSENGKKNPGADQWGNMVSELRSRVGDFFAYDFPVK